MANSEIVIKYAKKVVSAFDEDVSRTMYDEITSLKYALEVYKESLEKTKRIELKKKEKEK